MAILRNIDVARRFDVSPATVKNWIQYALQDKFQLDLTKIGERFYIEDSPINISRLSKIKAHGVKFRSKSELVTVQPSPKFYDIFEDDQINDIMNHIQYHHMIPLKYFSFHEGSKWIYESVYDVLELNEKYAEAIDNISFNLANFMRTVINKHPDRVINIFEMTTSVHTKFSKDTIQLLKDEGVVFNYISCARSKDVHALREIYLREYHQIEPVIKNIDFDSINIDVMSEYMQPDQINVFFVPGGWLNEIHNRSQVLHNLQQFCRPSIDYIALDVDLVTESTNSLTQKIGSNLISVQKKYLWLFKYLNIYSKCDNNVYNTNKNNTIFYRNLTTNASINFEYEIQGETYSFILPKDSELYYSQLYKFRFKEFVTLCNNTKLDLKNYYFTEEDTSGLFILTSKRFSLGD